MPARVGSIVSTIIKPPRIRRKVLRKYSWLPDVLRVEGSIIRRIVGPVLTVTLFATAVAYAWHEGHDVHLTNSVIPVVAVVVGLILVFRNGTSYDRYWEGRKDFASMNAHTRNLVRLIWVNVALPPADAPQNTRVPTSDLTPFALRRRKVRVIKLCLGFSYAVMHYLRGEDGLDHPDFEGVLPASFIRHGQLDHSHTVSRHESMPPSMINGVEGSSTSTLTRPEGSPERADHHDATKRVRVKRSKQTIKERTPLLPKGSHAISFEDTATTIPLPLTIAHEITRAIFVFKRDGLLETVGPAGTNTLNSLVQSMVDNLSSMERIANTPIPKAYTIHLKQIVTLYLFALPFTLVKELGWGMIPVVTVVAFTFMGVEGIADEIEMPFGQDVGDLPLEQYCSDLKEEIDYLIERLPEGGEGMYGFDDGEGDD